MTHEIKLEDLQAWIEGSPKILFASASGGETGRKTLEATINGSFIVTHKGVEVWSGIQPFNAVEKYNSI